MIFKILLFSFGLILITILLKDQMKSVALMVSVAGCVGLFMIALNIVSHLVSVAKGFGFSDGIASESIGVIAKTLGVAYLIRDCKLIEAVLGEASAVGFDLLAIPRCRNNRYFITVISQCYRSDCGYSAVYSVKVNLERI